MVSKNPVREVLQNLAHEFKIINTSCLHFDVEINALIEERTKEENKKFKRRLCRCLRLVDALKPETSKYYKDKSSEIMGMIRHIGDHYDDLKRRYFWALNRMAELTMTVNRLTEDLLIAEARHKKLGDGQKKDVCKHMKKKEKTKSTSTTSFRVKDEDLHFDKMRESSEKQVPQKKTKASQIGLKETLEKSTQTEAESLKKQHSSGVCTTFSKSANLMIIEDRPVVDKTEAGDQLISKNRILKTLSKIQKSLKKGKAERSKTVQELANMSEIKLQIYALTAELEEKNEIISALTSQMENRDLQIESLVEVIRREKLGLE